MHDYDYSLPDFSQPSLSADPAALEQPGLTLPNPQHSDPYLPDLLQPLIPADLELHATTIPAQALLDLPTNQATAELRQPDPARSEYQSQLQSPTQDGPVAINLAPRWQPWRTRPSPWPTPVPIAANCRQT